MQLKAGIKVTGIRSEVLLGLIVADKIWSNYGKELVVTEVTGSKHGYGSLHYVGLAADLRTNYFSSEDKEEVGTALRVALGSNYDVVVEPSHIHLEYQPK